MTGAIRNATTMERLEALYEQAKHEHEMNIPRLDHYTVLVDVLLEAYKQASEGKGSERHASDEDFDQQIICEVTRRLKGSPVAGPLFQAVKKIYESTRTDPIPELLGAINYIAAAIIVLREGK
jgi:hypothetical protein